MMSLTPPARDTDADQECVPLAVPLPPRLFTQVTDDTPTLSPAVPEIVSAGAVVVTAAVEGDVIAIVGAVLSGGDGTVKFPVVLHAVAPVDVIVCTCHVAAPVASVIPGDKVQVPPLPHPAAMALVVREMATRPVLSRTSSWYDAAPETPVHENAGVSVVIEPSGLSRVTAFGATPLTVQVNVPDIDNTPSDAVTFTV